MTPYPIEFSEIRSEATRYANTPHRITAESMLATTPEANAVPNSPPSENGFCCFAMLPSPFNTFYFYERKKEPMQTILACTGCYDSNTRSAL